MNLLVGIPAYNEEKTIADVIKAIPAKIDDIDEISVLVVDDGSIDKTWQTMKALNTQDQKWKIIKFSRNFGHQAAISAGLY